MTDEELLTEYLKTKDRELFTILHERMRDRLYSLALHMIHLPDDAEDIVQTVFCKLCKARSQEIRSAEGFLKTMTKRAALDHQRKEHSGVREGMISLDAYAGERQWKAKDSDDWIERRDGFNPEPFVRSPDTTIEKKESHEEIK